MSSTSYEFEGKVTVKKTKKDSMFSTKELVLIGMLAALSFILMLIKLPFSFLGFLEVEFSDIPAAVAGFMYGPIPAVVIEIVKNILKGITTSHTVGIGELANAIVASAYMFPTFFLFHKLKGKKKLYVSFAVGTICMAIVGALTNYYVLIPMYSKFIPGGIDGIINLAAETVPVIKDVAGVVVLGITPFNIVKGIAISGIGYLVFQKVRKIIQ